MNGQGLPDSEVDEILRSVTELANKGGLADIMTGLAAGQTDSKPDESKAQTDRRIALLRALKPYLGQERRAAIDKILQFASLGSMLGNFLQK